MSIFESSCVVRNEPGDGSLHEPLSWIGLDDDTILAELLLHENNLFRPLHDEVPSRVERTFGHSSELLIRLVEEVAFVAPEHDR